jgi:hypothetical protein
MTGSVRNMQAFKASLAAAEAAMKARFAQRVKDVVYTLHYEIVDRTPVWSGAIMANYQWSDGFPFSDTLEPIDNGPPGHTNEMPIGVEPRRAPNQALADASLHHLNFDNPFRVYYLNNNDPDIGGVEAGVLPPPPLVIRAAQGMIGVSLELVRAKLAAGQI